MEQIIIIISKINMLCNFSFKFVVKVYIHFKKYSYFQYSKQYVPFTTCFACATNVNRI